MKSSEKCPECGLPLAWQELNGKLTSFCPCQQVNNQMKLSMGTVKHGIKRSLNIGISGKQIKYGVYMVKGDAITMLKNYLNSLDVDLEFKNRELKDIAVKAAKHAHMDGRVMLKAEDVECIIGGK